MNSAIILLKIWRYGRYYIERYSIHIIQVLLILGKGLIIVLEVIQNWNDKNSYKFYNISTTKKRILGRVRIFWESIWEWTGFMSSAIQFLSAREYKKKMVFKTFFFLNDTH